MLSWIVVLFLLLLALQTQVADLTARLERATEHYVEAAERGHAKAAYVRARLPPTPACPPPACHPRPKTLQTSSEK